MSWCRESSVNKTMLAIPPRILSQSMATWMLCNVFTTWSRAFRAFCAILRMHHSEPRRNGCSSVIGYKHCTVRQQRAHHATPSISDPKYWGRCDSWQHWQHTVAQPDRRKRVETPSTQQTSTPRGGDRENLNVSEAVRVGVR